MSDNLIIEAGQYSEAGRKDANEDSCGIRIPDDYFLGTKGVAAIIADGVSNASKGREASESCVKGFLQDYYSTPESWSTKTSVQKVLVSLNRWLYGLSARQHRSSELGYVTTLSALVIKSSSVFIFHVGDTRIYRFRNNHLELLTRDHRIVSGDEKSFLSHALGVDENIEIDYSRHIAEQDDSYILMTDGTYEHIDHLTLSTLIKNHADPQELSETICKHAYRNGSNDNISCQILRIKHLPFYENENTFYERLTKLPFPPPLTEGMELDGFKVTRVLHSSDRAQTCMVKDIESGNIAVLKSPSISYSDDTNYIDSFLREEWVGKRISNSHVLKVLTHPRERSCLYYLTEYCEGGTLRQWMIDNPRPTLPEVRDIISQLLHGLLAFHRIDTVHLNINPENILIDKGNTVKLINFGHAKNVNTYEISKNVSYRKEPVNDYNYIAPELLIGNPGDVQSDYFSVGVIAYEMLTRKLPFGNEHKTLKQLHRAKYIPARRYNSDIPYWIDGALAKCVSKKKAHRYILSSEFIYDLSNPNKSFSKNDRRPLIESNPVRFWKTMAGVLATVSLLLIVLLLNHY